MTAPSLPSIRLALSPIAWLALCLLFGPGLLPGCGGSFETADVARDRAAELLDCPVAGLSMEQLGDYRFRAEGCRRGVVLVCTAGAMEARCFPERGSEVATAGSSNEENSEIHENAEENSDSSSGTEPDIEARIRAGLEARREDVLACVGSDRVAVRVEHAEDGALTLSLQGELAGSAEEGCVRQVLSFARGPRGPAGTVIHLLRAP